MMVVVNFKDDLAVNATLYPELVTFTALIMLASAFSECW
jgi:hypothetical protein